MYCSTFTTDYAATSSVQEQLLRLFMEKKSMACDSCEFHEIFREIPYTEHLCTIASGKSFLKTKTYQKKKVEYIFHKFFIHKT